MTRWPRRAGSSSAHRAGRSRGPPPPTSPARAPTSSGMAAGYAAPRSTRASTARMRRRPTRSGRPRRRGPCRFAIKLPKTITHELQLARARVPLERFLDETSGLGGKRGPILVQLPPSFAFDARVAGRFLTLLRARHDGPVVCEPRHATWASGAAEPAGAAPGRPRRRGSGAVSGRRRARWWPGLVYYRLHGSPRTYSSRHHALRLGPGPMRCAACPEGVEAWCVLRQHGVGRRAPERHRARRPAAARSVTSRPRPPRGPTLRRRRRGPGASWPAPWPRSGAPVRASATGGGRSRPASSRDRCPARSAGAAPRARDR